MTRYSWGSQGAHGDKLKQEEPNLNSYNFDNVMILILRL